MTHSRKLRSVVVMLTSISLTLLPAAAVSAAAPPTQGVRLTRVGAPTWKPADVHLFSAPVGTADSGYAEFGQTMENLLPLPNHDWHPDLGRGPGSPHPPPYTSEFASSIAAMHYREAVRFHKSEFSNGAGVFLVWMTVPAPGATGSSPDFASGPVIPNSVFPIHVVARSLHRSGVFNAYVADFNVPALNVANPPFNVDGHSHFPVFIADNADFGPAGAKLNGDFKYQIEMLDTTGSGWRVEANFTVAP